MNLKLLYPTLIIQISAGLMTYIHITSNIITHKHKFSAYSYFPIVLLASIIFFIIIYLYAKYFTKGYNKFKIFILALSFFILTLIIYLVSDSFKSNSYPFAPFINVFPHAISVFVILYCIILIKSKKIGFVVGINVACFQLGYFLAKYLPMMNVELYFQNNPWIIPILGFISIILISFSLLFLNNKYIFTPKKNQFSFNEIFKPQLLIIFFILSVLALTQKIPENNFLSLHSFDKNGNSFGVFFIIIEGIPIVGSILYGLLIDKYNLKYTFHIVILTNVNAYCFNIFSFLYNLLYCIIAYGDQYYIIENSISNNCIIGK